MDLKSKRPVLTSSPGVSDWRRRSTMTKRQVNGLRERGEVFVVAGEFIRGRIARRDFEAAAES